VCVCVCVRARARVCVCVFCIFYKCHVLILKRFIMRDTKKNGILLLIEFVKRLSEIDIRRKTQ